MGECVSRANNYETCFYFKHMEGLLYFKSHATQEFWFMLRQLLDRKVRGILNN